MGLLLLLQLLAVALLGAAEGGPEDVPHKKIDGELEFAAVKCAACEFVVDRLDRYEPMNGNQRLVLHPSLSYKFKKHCHQQS